MVATLKQSLLLCFFFLCFGVIVPRSSANKNNTENNNIDRGSDSYWKAKAVQAFKGFNAAYTFHPEEVAQNVDAQVGKFITFQKNSVGRILKAKKKRNYKGKCYASNPIDQCFRCDPKWADNRMKLADCALGFGRKAAGGKSGKFYEVTDNTDDPSNPKPGTLRHAVIQKEPLWITFSNPMLIKLQQELLIAPHKTIDGRGFEVHIASGCGLTMEYVHNIIIHNVHIHNISPCDGGFIRDAADHVGHRGKNDGDGIRVFGSNNIWIDHVTMHNCKDGLIDVTQGSTAVTISNCRFTHHDSVMLLGGQDDFAADERMRVTVAFNHFGPGLVQRMPRCRWGFFHVVNNDYSEWHSYAIGGSMHPTIISQGNRFTAGSVKEVTKRENSSKDEWQNWTWVSQGDSFENGAVFIPSGDPSVAKNFSSEDMIAATPGTMANELTKFAGYIGCRSGEGC